MQLRSSQQLNSDNSDIKNSIKLNNYKNSPLNSLFSDNLL